MPEFEDTTLTCKDCKEDWTWEAGEQAFFAEKGFDTPPRCPPCRKKNKERRESGGGGGGGDRRERY